MRIAVAGGKTKADYLIRMLLSKGHELVVINDDREYCTYLCQTHRIPVIHGDPCKLYVMDEAGIDGFDIMIALKPSDADNLAICQTAKRIYHIRKTLGVSTAISATYMIAGYIEQMSTVESLVNSLPLDQGNIVINELMINQNSPVAGRKLCDMELGEDAIICCIVRGSKIIVPKGQTGIQANDKLLVLSTPDSQNRVIGLIMGREQA